MDNLKADLDQLEDTRLDYVMERSRVNSDADAYRNCGISKSTFYSWDAGEREKLNEIAQKLKRQSALRAMLILQEAAEEAALLKVAGLKSRKENVAQACSTEIMDRTMGKPTQRQEITGKNGGEVNIKLVWPDADNTSEPA